MLAPATASAAAACGKPGYSYAGHQSLDPAHGVSATLTALSAPRVVDGHVAAWVGVGGPGAGPNGADEWLQVGLSAFPGIGNSLYYEVALPGRHPRYVLVESNVPAGARRRVAVLEMSRRPNFWRVWVGRKPVSPAIYLPASSGRWSPIATAETWRGARGVCNAFRYRFERVRTARMRGGSWRRFAAGHRFQDAGFRVQHAGPAQAPTTSFIAHAVGFSAPAPAPPPPVRSASTPPSAARTPLPQDTDRRADADEPPQP